MSTYDNYKHLEGVDMYKMLCFIVSCCAFGTCCSMNHVGSCLSDTNGQRIREFVKTSQYHDLEQQISALRTSANVTDEQFVKVIELAESMGQCFYNTSDTLCLDNGEDELFYNEIGQMFDGGICALGDVLKRKKGLSVFVEKYKPRLKGLGIIVENIQ